MTARQMIVPGAMPSRDANGASLPALFRFYLDGTDTPTTVYTSATLSVPLDFPIRSDAAGRWPDIWADAALYFNVGWSDQVFDNTIHVFTHIGPASDAVLASVAMASASADLAAASAAAAAASAAAAAAAAMKLMLTATSHSTNTIGTGSFTFILDQTPTDFAIGMPVQVTDVGNVANSMTGKVTAFAGSSLTMLVGAGGNTGAGTISSWSVSITALGGVLSVAGLTGIISAAALKTAMAIVPADVIGLTDAIDDEAIAMAIVF